MKIQICEHKPQKYDTLMDQSALFEWSKVSCYGFFEDKINAHVQSTLDEMYDVGKCEEVARLRNW